MRSYKCQKNIINYRNWLIKLLKFQHQRSVLVEFVNWKEIWKKCVTDFILDSIRNILLLLLIFLLCVSISFFFFIFEDHDTLHVNVFNNASKHWVNIGSKQWSKTWSRLNVFTSSSSRKINPQIKVLCDLQKKK